MLLWYYWRDYICCFCHSILKLDNWLFKSLRRIISDFGFAVDSRRLTIIMIILSLEFVDLQVELNLSIVAVVIIQVDWQFSSLDLINEWIIAEKWEENKFHSVNYQKLIIISVEIWNREKNRSLNYFQFYCIISIFYISLELIKIKIKYLLASFDSNKFSIFFNLCVPSSYKHKKSPQKSLQNVRKLEMFNVRQEFARTIKYKTPQIFPPANVI